MMEGDRPLGPPKCVVQFRDGGGDGGDSGNGGNGGDGEDSGDGEDVHGARQS